jgi:hypothetical protein
MMTEQERAESFLRTHTGLFFCAACLAQELGLTAFRGRNVMWKLQTQPGFEMRGRKCVSCSRGKRTIRHVGGFAVLGPTAQVVVFLLGNKGIYLCDACVAFATELRLAEVRRAIASVEPLAEFEQRDGSCTVCSRVAPLICAAGSDAADAGGVAQIVTGSAAYRGWRIDLLSYQTPEGWRPFVLISGPASTRVPDAPEFLWGARPSKLEAHEAAFQAARDWIDKKFAS